MALIPLANLGSMFLTLIASDARFVTEEVALRAIERGFPHPGTNFAAWEAKWVVVETVLSPNLRYWGPFFFTQRAAFATLLVARLAARTGAVTARLTLRVALLTVLATRWRALFKKLRR